MLTKEFARKHETKWVLASVIVVAHNEAATLGRVFDALMPLIQDDTYEVVLVDVGSTDQTLSVLDRFPVQYVLTDVVSAAKARNAGARIASGKFLAFIDGDVVVTSEWIEALDKVANSRQKILTGAPCLPAKDAKWLERTWFGTQAKFGTPNYINSGNLIIHRQLFSSLSGFNETMSTGEDFDLCKRVRREGNQVEINRQFSAIHLGFPKSALEFLFREAWHGSGLGLRQALFSKVGIASLAFMTSNTIFLTGVLLANFLIACFGFFSILCIGVGVAFIRFRHVGIFWVARLTPIALLYLYGRMLGYVMPKSKLLAWRNRLNPLKS